MNATTATQATRQTADERREAIVAAALHAFAEGGYSGTSTESIARAVGVSQPYVFQLFGTKRELFLAVVRHGFRRTRSVFHEAARRGPDDDRDCTILHLMGEAYMRLLSDRDLLRVQLQAYAACGDDDVRQVVREEFAAMHAAVKADSGASNDEIHHFFAEGMLLNVAAALELGGEPETWSLSGLLAKHDHVGSSGGVA
jgi:AcrR family transcriptional regulator